MLQLIDPEEIKKAVSLIQSDIFECRVIQGKKIYSGYFRDSGKLIDALKKQNLKGANVYTTLQHLHEGCEARLQWETLLDTSLYKIPTTSDNDIISYHWLPIDADPCRPAGISSTADELEAAFDLQEEVKAYMSAQGFNRYIAGMSGNGTHTLYDISGMNMRSEDVKRILDRLNELFSNDLVHVDTTVHNPGRIWKLYGTLAQKGRHTEKRPFRMARITEVHLEEDQ